MSYARFGDNSDVYVFPHVGGGFECCACTLAPLVKSIFTEGCTNNPLFGTITPCKKCNGTGCEHCMLHGSTRLNTRSEMIAHLKDHIKAGHRVPKYAIETLEKELKEEGEINQPVFDDGYDGPVVIDVVSGTVSKITD